MSLNKKIENFVKERDEALLSLDKAKILAYAEKYDVRFPKNELVFWASVHKSILAINSADEAQKAKSKAWLLKHGFKPSF